MVVVPLLEDGTKSATAGFVDILYALPLPNTFTIKHFRK